MPDERAARVAHNEARFREINERVERDLIEMVQAPDETLPFVCECGRRDCGATVEVTLGDYERVRSDSTCFVLMPGHEMPDLETVVDRGAGFVVVRKHPETQDIARDTDPRR